VHLDRDTATIVLDAQRAVAVDVDPDVFAIAREMLIDGVIDDFKDAVVEASLIGIADVHSGAEADGSEPFQVLDLFGTVSLVGGYGGGV
jgi:threonine dehydrogenase-like Zn-dependent dehydrogenase